MDENKEYNTQYVGIDKAKFDTLVQTFLSTGFSPMSLNFVKQFSELLENGSFFPFINKIEK